MIQYIVLSYVIIAFIIASYEDIKKREVYDYLNFLLTFLVLITALFDSLLSNSLLPLKTVGFGLLIGFVLGSFFYYVGLWGGGDSKFLIGFSAASYYLISFSNSQSLMSILYERIMDNFSLVLIPFLNSFIKIVLIVDYVILFLLVLFLTFSKKTIEKLQIIIILSLLSFGLYSQASQIILVILGFLAFLLLFFAKEDIFSSIHLVLQKPLNKIKVYDKINSDIYKNNNKIITFKNAKNGLSKEQIILLNKEFSKSKKIEIRKNFPLASLIAINFICFVLLIVTINKLNLEILSFLLKFLFFSFLIGGILGILIILFFAIKNYNKIKFKLNSLEKILLSSILIFSILFSLLNSNFLLFSLLVFIYLFIKIAKQIEKIIFVSKKPLNKIVPGDWIVEDIIINETKIYTSNDFKLGINEEQLERLHKLAKEHKHLNSIKVKDGIPFLPPLFIAFLIIMFI